MDDTTKLAVSQVAGAIVIAGAIVWGACQISEALPGNPGQKTRATAPSASPVSPRDFARQWEAHYAANAEETCWRPFDAQYLRLPGHLDLTLDVSAEGTVSEVHLVGYTNPDDSPDPALAQQVFGCVAAILKAASFPAAQDTYRVEGRVNRPAPPPPSGGSPAGSPDEPSPEADSTNG